MINVKFCKIQKSNYEKKNFLWKKNKGDVQITLDLDQAVKNDKDLNLQRQNLKKIHPSEEGLFSSKIRIVSPTFRWGEEMTMGEREAAKQRRLEGREEGEEEDR